MPRKKKIREKVTRHRDANQTTERNSSDANQTTERNYSDANQTTERNSSDANQTTERNYSDANQTTERNYSDANQTTERNSRDANQTTERNSSDANQTTERNYSDANQTTERNSRDANQTTERNYSDANQTTERNSSDANQTTERNYSDANQTTERNYSDANQTTERNSSDANQMTERNSSDANQTTERKAPALCEKSQSGVRLPRVYLSCSICLELLKFPVTTPCGHNFCLNCIQSYWENMSWTGRDSFHNYICPQCRRAFTPRPYLAKNTMLADLVEELEKIVLEAALPPFLYAGIEDVPCDVCCGRKRAAIKSCLVCLASFCEKHLQPHYESPAFQKHTLVETAVGLEENVCPLHNEMMKMYCRTDQRCICYLCSLEEHKYHDTVSAAAETMLKQKELELVLQQRFRIGEEDKKILDRELEALNKAADKAVEDSEKIFTELIRLLQRRSHDVKQQIRSQQTTEVCRIRILQEDLKEEISDLKSTEHRMKQYLKADDPNELLHCYSGLSDISPSTHSSIINAQNRKYFEDVSAAVEKVRGQLQSILTETQHLLPQPEPKTRAEFFRYSKKITVDPNMIDPCMSLSDGNRKITLLDAPPYPHDSFAFYGMRQVMSKESLTGRCYWEVEWKLKDGSVNIAVAYRKTGPRDDGATNRSWSLICSSYDWTFSHRSRSVYVSMGSTSRVGVYLDHSAGVLSFYSISNTMTLLHRVQTAFSEPLHARLSVNAYSDAVAEFCKLR